MGNLSNFGSGAAGGALAGASIGGPWGAVIGGVGGGILGLLSGSDKDKARNSYESYQNEVRKRGLPQAGMSAQADYSGFRDNQSNLVSHLEAMSQGRGPSLAAEQFKQSNDRNVASQQALAQSGQGNATAQAMMAANNSAQLGAQSAQDAGVARIQEQQMALNQLGMTLHGARGMDEQTNQFNANERNQTNLANLDAQLRASGMNDQTRLQIMAQLAGSAGPSMGESILAGGASMYSMGAANKAANKGANPNQPQLSYPGGY